MILAISGKLNSGKDTVGRIIQIMTDSPHFTNEGVVSFIGKPALNPKWEIRRFADKIKDIVCMLLSCTREQLEDREFKEKELGEEWWYWKIFGYNGTNSSGNFILIPYDNSEPDKYDKVALIKPTPRKLLQLLGTECGRQIIHPNIWVNALMSEYNKGRRFKLMNANTSIDTTDRWIITDTRFPNELEAIKSRGGITIRVNRPYQKGTCVIDVFGNPDTIIKWEKAIDGRGKYIYYVDDSEEFWRDFDIKLSKEHESETSLDSAIFDYTIENDGTLLELVEKVREILNKKKYYELMEIK